MVTPELVERCQNRLLLDKTQLENLLSGYPHPLNIGEGFEKGDEYNIQLVNCRNHQTSKEKLTDVIAALERIKKGVFGLCLNDVGNPGCEIEINPDRLDSYPEVKRCKSCQEKHDKMKGRKYW